MNDNIAKLFKDCPYHPTGSTYICSPPVTDTDVDFLILPDVKFETSHRILTNEGFTLSKSDDEDYPDCGNFNAYRKGDINLIVCLNEDFYEKFVTATEVCKRLNLLEKSDRIMVHQAVLYGNRSWEGL